MLILHSCILFFSFAAALDYSKGTRVQIYSTKHTFHEIDANLSFAQSQIST